MTAPLYDGGDWDTFPTRCGWLDESGTETYPSDDVPSEYQSLMHCGLYFGVLHYVFGDQLDQSDFLLREDEEGEQQYVTTRQLEKYVGDVDDWNNNDRGARCVEIRGGHQPTPRSSGYLFLSVKEEEKLISDGWCPLNVARCASAGIQLDAQVYLLQLARSKPSWYNRTHDSCQKTECVADSIDKSINVTRHVQEDCNCLHVDADIEQLHGILQDGGIRIVRITPCGEDELGNRQFEVKVVKKCSSKPYVAVSHVWADGLGNPHANSLSHCQLEFLYDHTRLLLREKGYSLLQREDIWTPAQSDTLCIPHQNDVRSLAIQCIRDVYTGAYRTIMIDSSLIMIDSRSYTKLEVCLRVLYCSGWICRLWTLQEALAAEEKLYVLLADKAVNISTITDGLMDKVDKGEIPILQEGMATMAAGAWCMHFQQPNVYASAFRRMILKNTQDQVIAWTWFNVATRASSKDRDRATVLAGILNLDVKKILEVDEAEERMRSLYGMLERFLQDVSFLEGPRFEEEGMGWVVQVCRFTGAFCPLSHDASKITPRGLQVSLYASMMRKDLESWIDASQFDRQRRASGTKVFRLSIATPLDLSADVTYGFILKEPQLYVISLCAVASLQTTEDGVCYGRYVTSGNIEAIILDMLEPPPFGSLIRGTWHDAEMRTWIVG
ncbi:uncharacterized protein BDV17DRAFT_279769 [Aspergillus undulatus]|uniref:uncharacterized protein n=1 Tax=Aspergillus undulatus TaxID=1810928 RepID=UPI003CCDC2FB